MRTTDKKMRTCSPSHDREQVRKAIQKMEAYDINRLSALAETFNMSLAKVNFMWNAIKNY